MRISDWSSDVCSSDLARSGQGAGGKRCVPEIQSQLWRDHAAGPARADSGGSHQAGISRQIRKAASGDGGRSHAGAGGEALPGSSGADAVSVRSEEHTSELQSLMRISYAVFCLKKKNKKNRA